MTEHTMPMMLQTGTFNALIQGVNDGDTTIKTLSQHGNFGLGTFDAMNGELIAFDGNFYRVDGEGKVMPADINMRTPFAVITHFHETSRFALKNISDIDVLFSELDSKIGSKNYIYAIRIDGQFKNMRLRSLKPNPFPYQPLTDVLKDIQFKFELKETSGTIVAVRFPNFMSDLNVPGYHLHYLDHLKTAGGHVFGCSVEEASVHVGEIENFAMHLPKNEMFANADLKSDKKAIEKIEKE